MVSLQRLSEDAKAHLKSAGIESPRFECNLLLKKHFSITEYDLIIRDYSVSQEDCLSFHNDIEARKNHKPLQYILGEWEFMGLNFMLTEDVLIPRADTETVVQYAIEMLSARQCVTFADLCTGSGCIAASVAKYIESSRGVAVDISPAAIKIARHNMELNCIQDRVSVIEYDIFKGAAGLFNDESLDLIISNPPYITGDEMHALPPEVKNEPYIALYGGSDGLDFYRFIIPEYKKALKHGGYMCLETGFAQANSVCEILSQCDYTSIDKKKDLHGIFRAVTAMRI